MNGIFINSDAWNFWLDNPELAEGGRDAIVRAIRRDVEFYAAGGGVAALFYNLNFQRSFYPTRVGTPFWKDLEVGSGGALLLRGRPLSGKHGGSSDYGRMLLAARNVNGTVPDFIAVRYAACHGMGVEMWHSMRMDDVHHTDLGSEWLPQHGDLWLDRKDLTRAWYRHPLRWSWADAALDYGRPEVFDYHLAMMREYVLDYESDGIELDWMRCAPVFAPGSDEANAPLLTRFMRETRAACAAAAARWGHPVRVAVRVPARAREAYGMGMDIGAWAREGLFDVLVPSCRDILTEQDCDLPIYRALCPPPILIAPCLDYQMSSDADSACRLGFCGECDFGFASGWYADGADTVYCYNHFPRHVAECHPGFPGEFAALGDRAAVMAAPRRHVFTGHRPCGEGECFHPPYPDAVWAGCTNGGVKVNCGEGTAGRAATVFLGMKREAALEVVVNTVPCVAARNATLPSPLPENCGGKVLWSVFDIPAGAIHDGWNNVEFINRGDADVAAGDFAWLEVDIA